MVKIIAEGENNTYTVKQLLEIMSALRGPGGCPWDIEQTHRSIKNDAVEEVYEVVDAIENDDAAGMCEELGDMLLQVVFHSRIAEENGEFTFKEVVDGICKKLILRHPHVFGEEHIETAGAVLDRWESIKKEEKHQQTYTDTLKSVPKAFPALMRGAKVQKRAAKAGVDIKNSLADSTLADALSELESISKSGDKDAITKAYGRFLFLAAGLQQTIGVNAEEALNLATEDYIARFEQAEKNGTLKNF